MTTLAPSAWWFDGRCAAAVPVQLELDAQRLVAADADGRRRSDAALDALDVPERFAHGPLTLRLAGGATVLVDEPAQAAAVEAALARPRSAVRRLQDSWPAVLVVVAAIVTALVALYVKGVPWATQRIADTMPPSIEARIGADILKLLDRRLLTASALPDVDQARIAQRFAEFAGRSSPGVDYRLEFRAPRSGPAINAFALPGGTIVVLDGLVEASGEDERVLAVLGHELGHVALRHPIRRVLATVGVGVLAGLLWGDISSVAANLGTVLGVLRYSREQEIEADDHAARMLDDAGLDARPLIEMFAILLNESRARGSVPGALATHPSLEERIQRLRTRPVRLERKRPPN